jgi:hypothetical protein
MKKLILITLLLAGLTLFLPARWFFPELVGIASDPCIFPDSSSLRIR